MNLNLHVRPLFFYGLFRLGGFFHVADIFHGKGCSYLAMVCGVIPACGFLLPCSGEVAYPLHVTDDTCHVVHVGAVTVRALLQVTLVYVAAVVADGVRDVESKLVATLFCSNSQKLPVLGL